MYVFGQSPTPDIVTTIANSSQWGIAGAMLILTIAFIRYIQVKEDQDRKERKEMSESYHKVIDNLATKVEAMATTLTSAFAAEIAAERVEHRHDIAEISQLTHNLRGMAAEAVSAKELSRMLAQQQEERKDNK